jgi:signal transduction histidine kinase
MALAQPKGRLLKQVALESLINATSQTLALALPHTVKLEFDVLPGMPEVEVDENEIRQVIYNLVLNARDAMPEGGTIRVTGGVETVSTPRAVVGSSLPVGRWATLSVTDSGPGIDPAIREQIFDLFFSTKSQDGTGIGLATVLRIANASGGGIAVESAAGRGTTFTLYLPACERGVSLAARGNNSPGTRVA